VIYWRFLSEKKGKLAESHRKNPETFRPENCFHVPLISGIFLQESTRTSQPEFIKLIATNHN
jgi:hypothetical protein